MRGNFGLFRIVLAQNWLASTLDYILMQTRKTNREEGVWFCNFFRRLKFNKIYPISVTKIAEITYAIY